MDKSKIRENIRLTIKCFIDRYQYDDNFLFLSESDIQCSLYSDLIKTVNYRLPLQITENQGIDRLPPVINIIQTEYSKDRIDIACIDSMQTKDKIKYEKDNSIDKFLWDLPLLVGIELKYLQYNYITQRKIGEFLADINKLEKSSKRYPDMHWIALAFVQNDSSWKRIMDFIDEKQGYGYKPINNSEIELKKDAYIITPKQILRVCKK